MTNKNILISGNEACAEAAITAGCRFYAGYPITPQNELTKYMAERMREVGGVFIQSESEIAAINMVFGASLAGAKAMTSSSGPGISLKQEGISYIAACRLPAVIINVMRGGPGLGNIAPAQGDYFQATRGGGHGDYRTIVLAPASVSESALLTYRAFELTEKYRVPAIILSDGMIGQMMETVSSKIFDKKEVENKRNWILTGCAGRQPRLVKSLFLEQGALEGLNKTLQQTYKKIEQKEVIVETDYEKDSKLLVVSYGSVSRIVKACVKKLRKQNIKVGFIRPVTLWPFPHFEVKKLAGKKTNFLVVEMSEGQMVEDVRLAAEGRSKVYFYGRSGGHIPTEEEIAKEIKKYIK